MATRLHISSGWFGGRIGALVLCGVSLAIVSCGHTQAAPSVPISSVMQTIREYGRAGQPSTGGAKQTPHPATLVSDSVYDLDGPYQAHIAAILAQNDYAQLEREAQQVRGSKSRLQGGVWKLFGFYEGVGKPSAGDSASDSDWGAHLASVKRWIVAFPNSATAQIALADSYVNYAWAARGNGFA